MMNTMTAKSLEQSLSFSLKQERDFILEDIDNDDATLDEINNLLSMPLPSISGKNFLVPADPNNEFLRLTTMNEELPCNELKKCTDELELNAVRCSLEASLYRQNMLRLISDIKSHTSEKKIYKKLLIFLETPPDKVDVGIQTDNSWYDLEKADNIQSVCISSNCEELSPSKQICSVEQSVLKGSDFEDTLLHSDHIKTASPTVNSTSCYERENIKSDNESDEEKGKKMIVEESVKQKAEVIDQEEIKDNSDSLVGQTDQSFLHNEDENSQDSLLQHMEDMFCESDDSSDLTTLIEKHSGVSKANVDKEINKMCLESSNFFTVPSSSQTSESRKDDKANATKMSHANQQGRFSFSYYKEMKSRGADKLVSSKDNETAEAKQKRKTNGIWFVERVHQVSKLKAKMTELSLRNYRKHGRVKQKFIELFGESDEEDMMPDSPICIEEHLTSCKERIAPWIVKYLMPFYKKRRIKDRQLFKAVAKHIADMLIIENTFPEQDCVSKYIEGYFRNKKFIKTKQDIYL